MSDRLRILLVNAIKPNVEWETRQPHLGLVYLAACVRKGIPDAKIQFRVVESKVRAEAERFRPDLVGISSVSQNFDIARSYVEFFADRGVPVILGGIHISVLPKCLPLRATAACLGESEQTFVDVVRAVLNDDLPSGLHGIPGVAFWEGDTLRLTPERPLPANLDFLPMPARDLLPIRSHTYMFTSRGCPFRCTFCSSSRYWDKLRFFSPEYVVEEIGLLVRDYGVRLISFYDDLFAANRPRVEMVLRLLEKQRLLGKVRFTMNCRANLVDAELATMLSRMGVVSVGMGLESGDEDTLRFLKGGNISVRHNHAAINHLKDAGIAANASFVIGSPRETREQVMKTYDFIRRSRLDLFDSYLLTPYPGTPVWEYARERGLVSEEMADWSRLDVNVYRAPEKAIVLSEVIERKELIALYRKFQRYRFWRNLLRVWWHPLRGDVPRMAWMLLLDRIVRLLHR